MWGVLGEAEGGQKFANFLLKFCKKFAKKIGRFCQNLTIFG
jgi:hypothetical protein